MCRSFTAWLAFSVCISVGAFLCLPVGEVYGDEGMTAESKHGKTEGSATVDHKEGTDSHGQTGDHGSGENGPPMSFTTDLALWSAIVFVLFLFVLKKFAWLPMIEGLDKREAGIRQAISDAGEDRRKSQALLAEYEQKLKNAERTVQEMVAEARRDAERTGQDLMANAKREVEAIRDRAKDDIRQAKDTALAEVFTQMNSQVLLATEHVLGRVLQDGDQDRLVGQALEAIGR